MLTYDAAAYGSEDLTVLITTAGDWTLEIPLRGRQRGFSGRGIGYQRPVLVDGSAAPHHYLRRQRP